MAWTDAGGLEAFWLPEHRRPTGYWTEALLATATAGICLTMIGAMLLMMLVELGAAPGSLTGRPLRFLAWHLLDGVPVLDLTTAWWPDPHVTFTHGPGSS